MNIFFKNTTSLIFVALIIVTCSACDSQPLGKTVASDDSSATVSSEPAPLDAFNKLKSTDIKIANEGLKTISEQWHPGSATMLIEIARFSGNRFVPKKIADLMERKTGQSFGSNSTKWYQWIWNQKYDPHPDYETFKRELYLTKDSSFGEYFAMTQTATIRLDEVRWGGVARDGIPPLKDPAMIPADEANYLEDPNVVFGIAWNGDFRCYPKRILACHEMFKDTIGGESVCGVY